MIRDAEQRPRDGHRFHAGLADGLRIEGRREGQT
jgi:hypothetical protein